MPLPNADRAIIPRPKLTDYLLSITHRDGRGKAAFFGAFGFSATAWEDFAAALRRHAIAGKVARIEETPFGTIYTVEGSLLAPDGRAPLVRVVWFIAATETLPRLVTAYPLKGARP
jgi:hypothetical protein